MTHKSKFKPHAIFLFEGFLLFFYISNHMLNRRRRRTWWATPATPCPALSRRWFQCSVLRPPPSRKLSLGGSVGSKLKAAVEVPLPIYSLALLRCDLAVRRRRETYRTSSTWSRRIEKRGKREPASTRPSSCSVPPGLPPPPAAWPPASIAREREWVEEFGSMCSVEKEQMIRGMFVFL